MAITAYLKEVNHIELRCLFQFYFQRDQLPMTRFSISTPCVDKTTSYLSRHANLTYNGGEGIL